MSSVLFSCVHESYFFHFVCFFFNDTATTEIYTLSLHDALPISVIDESLDIMVWALKQNDPEHLLDIPEAGWALIEIGRAHV